MNNAQMNENPAAERPLSVALERIAAEITQLDDALSDLERRLDPICKDPVPVADGEDKYPQEIAPSMSQTVARLDTYADMLKKQRNHVMDIYDRLDV